MGVVSRLRSIGSGSCVAVRANLVNLGFVAALVILVIIAVASYRSIERLEEHVRLVERTRQVRSGMYELLALCADARIAWRNFLTEGPGSDVASFETMGASIDRRIRPLKALTADNPGQQQRLSKFRARGAARPALPGLARVRLVAMTGYGQEDDRRRASDAGFDSHFVKPLDVEDLATIIE